MRLFLRLLREEEGQGLVEYVLIYSLIVIVVIAALGVFGTSLGAYYDEIASKI